VWVDRRIPLALNEFGWSKATPGGRSSRGGFLGHFWRTKQRMYSKDSLVTALLDDDLLLSGNHDKLYNGIRRMNLNGLYLIVDRPAKVRRFLSRFLMAGNRVFTDSLVLHRMRQ
jgi:hypothetical protein